MSEYYLKEISERYAYQFKQEPFCVQLPDGWVKIFAIACGLIDKQLGENEKLFFNWEQCNEKLGGMRLYFSINDFPENKTISAKLYHKLEKICRDTEDLSVSVCQVCGVRGGYHFEHGGSFTLCHNHGNKREWTKDDI